MKVLAVLYSGGSAAKEEPRLLGTTENEAGRLPNTTRDDTLNLVLAWSPQMAGEPRPRIHRN